MTVKVALVISANKNYRASPSGKGSIRKVQTEICYNFHQIVLSLKYSIKPFLCKTR